MKNRKYIWILMALLGIIVCIIATKQERAPEMNPYRNIKVATSHNTDLDKIPDDGNLTFPRKSLLQSVNHTLPMWQYVGDLDTELVHAQMYLYYKVGYFRYDKENDKDCFDIDAIILLINNDGKAIAQPREDVTIYSLMRYLRIRSPVRDEMLDALWYYDLFMDDKDNVRVTQKRTEYLKAVRLDSKNWFNVRTKYSDTYRVVSPDVNLIYETILKKMANGDVIVYPIAALDNPTWRGTPPYNLPVNDPKVQALYSKENKEHFLMMPSEKS